MNNVSKIPVIILAGGKGTRIKHLLGDLPKPMYPVFSIPFLEYVISYLQKFGLTTIYISSGYQSNEIEKYFSNKPEIKIIKEEEALGTGGAILYSISKINNATELIVLNGDTLFLINYTDFIKNALQNNSSTIALKKNSDTTRYGSVLLNAKNQIESFNEKSVTNSSDKLINGGIYFLKREQLINLDLPKINSIETDIFPKLCEKKQLYGYPQDFNSEFIDIGTPETLVEVENFIKKHRLLIN